MGREGASHETLRGHMAGWQTDLVGYAGKSHATKY